ncbi:Ribonuclease P protein subunit p40 [Balamuthia mandrillaris]
MEFFGFAAPKAKVVVWRSSFEHPNSCHKALVQTHWFNYKVEVFFPSPVVSRSEEELEEEEQQSQSDRAKKRKAIEENADFISVADSSEEEEEAEGSSSTNAKDDTKDTYHHDPVHQLLSSFSPYSEESSPNDIFYFLPNCSLSRLLEPSFLNAHVRQGELRAISIGSRIDAQNVCAILPNGKMLLSLDKDTYEQLGLTGRKAAFPPRHSQEWDVSLDLRAASFRPGKNLYDRVKWCLGEDRLAGIDLLLAWCPQLGSAPAEMTFPEEVQHKQLRLKSEQHFFKSIRVPILEQRVLDEALIYETDHRRRHKKQKDKKNHNNKGKSGATNAKKKDKEKADKEGVSEKEEKEEEEEEDVLKTELTKQDKAGADTEQLKGKLAETGQLFLLELYECIGMISSRAETLSSPNGMLSPSSDSPFTFTYLNEFYEASRGYSFSWRGLLLPHHITQCLNLARKHVREGIVPFAIVSVWGFQDSPVSWGKHQHSFLYGGENDYTFVVLPHEQYLLYLATGTFDTFS